MQYNKETQITLAGISADTQKYGHKIFKDLLAADYDVVGVNPKGGSILHQEIYTSLDEVNRNTELLILVVPPNIGIEIIRKAKNLGIKNIWLQPGAENEELVQYAKANDINLTYNSCFMVVQGIW